FVAAQVKKWDSGCQRKMDVIFHVLLDTSIMQDKEVFHGVVLKISSKNEKHVLREEYMYEDEKYTELTTRVTFPVKSVFNTIYYEYEFKIAGCTKPEYRKGNTRCINAPKMKARNGIYHQYDGIIRLESGRSVFQLEVTALKNDASKAAKYFVKRIHISSSKNNFDGVTGEDLVSEINFLFTSMETAYSKINFRDVRSMIRQRIPSVFKTMFEDMTAGNITGEKNRQLLLINAMTAAYCLKEHFIELTDEQKGYICLALLPRLDKQSDQCMDISALYCAFPNAH
ncbi:Hypothetical predicted protein, partial [Mytilus galloprovincialis]